MKRGGEFTTENARRAALGERMTLTVSEAATLLGLSAQTIRKAIVAGQIPALELGKRVLIPKIAIARLVGSWPVVRRSENLAVSRKELYVSGRLPPVGRGWMEAPIELLHLSFRSQNALKRAGVQVIGQLSAMPYGELLEMGGIGPTSVAEIESALARLER